MNLDFPKSSFEQAILGRSFDYAQRLAKQHEITLIKRGTIMTMQFSPERLTVQTDQHDLITSCEGWG